MKSALTTVVMIPMLACGALAPDGYNGEPLVQLHGSVTNPQGLAFESDDTRAWLLWVGPQAVAAAQTDVIATVPSEFTLDVLEPPAEEQFLTDGEQRFALGQVFFMSPAQKDMLLTGLNSGTRPIDTGVIGVARASIYYFDDEGDARALLGPDAHAGFNQLGIVTGECSTPEGDTVPCEGSALVPIDTPIPLRLHPNFGDGVNL